MTTPQLAPHRVLVVDDERAQMQALCDTLASQGYDVRGCLNAEQALLLLRQAPADVLLADLAMPGMDGIALLREALALDPMLTGIIMTGEGTISTAVEAMKTGAFDYILKPFRLSAVLAILSRGLEIRRLRIENVTLERRLRERAAELEAANRELDAFTRSASHDLRSPLNGVLGLSGLLLKRLGTRLSDQERGWMKDVIRAGKQMNQLLDDLMRLSLMGRQSLKLGTVDPGAAAARAADDLCRRDYPGRRGEVQIDALPLVLADEGLLSQVFVNLLSNALKFTRGMPAPSVQVGAEIADGEQVFFVRDNGPGFDMAEAGQLFDAFHRLPSAHQVEGSGVGLSIVHRIVTRHGGRVWAQAVVGQGACFRFTLGEGTPDR